MTIQVTKEPINLREKLNELETNKGLKGNEILQAETAQEVRSLIGAGRKNLIINGGFDVWQRGTSQTGVVDSAYQTVDRFKGRRSTVTADITKGTSTLPDNSKVNTFKITATSSATGYVGLSQAFEQSVFDYIDNRTVTLSCWIKTNRTDITFRHASINNFSVGSYNADGTWQKISGTYTVPAGSTSMQFDILTFANSTSAHTIGDYFEIANLQLELGSVATDFEHRSYGEELALCQRYYEEMYLPNAVPVTVGQGYNTRKRIGPFNFLVQKRVTPSIPAAYVDIDGGDSSHYFTFPASTTVAVGKSTDNVANIGGYDIAGQYGLTLKIDAEL
jgi:hypothetical protein